MTGTDDADLYRRGIATLLACWEQNANGAHGDARVQRSAGVAVAVFPDEPERGVYNNAVLTRGLSASQRGDALDEMETTYAEAGITVFAAWTHESDDAMQSDLERRGYAMTETTRAMGMSLGEMAPPRSDVDLAPSDWFEYLRIVGVPRNFLAGADYDAYHVLIARLGGESVCAGMAFDEAGDCGIFNVGTLEPARRRGVATGLTAQLLRDAGSRGCETATLQSTPIAEGVYSALGFRDLGRILEYGRR